MTEDAAVRAAAKLAVFFRPASSFLHQLARARGVARRADIREDDALATTLT